MHEYRLDDKECDEISSIQVVRIVILILYIYLYPIKGKTLSVYIIGLNKIECTNLKIYIACP